MVMRCAWSLDVWRRDPDMTRENVKTKDEGETETAALLSLKDYPRDENSSQVTKSIAVMQV